MNATVLVEKIGKGKYRASTSYPILLETEGKSKEEALRRLRKQAQDRLAAGELVRIALPGHEANPWKEFAGIWKDHPDFDEFVNNITAHRRSLNGRNTPE